MERLDVSTVGSSKLDYKQGISAALVSETLTKGLCSWLHVGSPATAVGTALLPGVLQSLFSAMEIAAEEEFLVVARSEILPAVAEATQERSRTLMS